MLPGGAHSVAEQTHRAPALWQSYGMLHLPDCFLSAVGYSFGSSTPQKIQSTARTCALDKEAAERLCPDLSASSGPGAWGMGELLGSILNGWGFQGLH